MQLLYHFASSELKNVIL